MNGVTSFIAEPHDKGIINIEELVHRDRSFSDLVIQKIGNDFYTNNHKDSWILFDFKNYQINLEYYSIRLYRSGNWIIEASTDKKEWKTIDKRSDDYNVLASFEMMY